MTDKRKGISKQTPKGTPQPEEEDKQGITRRYIQMKLIDEPRQKGQSKNGCITNLIYIDGDFKNKTTELNTIIGNYLDLTHIRFENCSIDEFKPIKE